MKVYDNICIKEKIDDFIVTEVPCIPEGITKNLSIAKFTVMKLTKRNLTSFEAMRFIAEGLGLEVSKVQCLGLKDEDGITEQLVSAEIILSDDDIRLLVNHLEKKGLLIKLELICHTILPLMVKRLHGNLFRIKLRHLKDDEVTKLFESLKRDPKLPFINYYDQQRFGLPGGPYLTHKIGEALALNKLKAAAKYYAESGNASHDGIDVKDISENVFDKINPRKKDFFVSAYTSFIWNDSVSHEIKINSVDQNSVNVFRGYDLKVCNNPQIETVHYVDGYEADKAGKIIACKKGRRSVEFTNVFAEKPKKQNNGTIVINFFLPMGCYATMAVKQMLAVRLTE